jgi:Domain of unknown function (DUF4878)
MKPRSMVFGGLVLATLVLAAGAGADKKDKVYKSPQDVFDAAQSAIKKDDYKAFFGMVTPDSQKMMAGQLVLMGAMIKRFADLDPSGKAKEMLKPIDELMTKHGVTEEALKKVKPDTDKSKASRAMGDLVKDRPGFVAGMMKILDKNTPPGKEKSKPFQDAELKDVKVEGDKAKGTVVTKKDDKEKKEPIEFVKIGDSWKIVVPEPPAKGRKTPKED